MTTIADNIAKVQARIQQAASSCGRTTDSVLLMAVSKTQPFTAIAEAHAAGLCHFGENYLQEALAKQRALAGVPLTWHFIGAIQSNKTADIAANFDWVHSVDRLKIAERLSRQRPAGSPPLNICIEVNIDQQDSKSGVLLQELPSLAKAIAPLPGLSLRGLMTIPDPNRPPATRQATFGRLAESLVALRQLCPSAPLDTLSMGMTDDLEPAIAAGATIVRIGTAIFGPRHGHT